MTASIPAKTRDILKARARELAKPAGSDLGGEKTLETIEFRLASETYAIEHAYVREVHPLKDLTPLPCTPAFVRGVVNLRGQIVPVIDFKKFFDLPDAGIADVHRVIIIQGLGIELGIEADAIVGMRSIPLGEITASLPTLTGVRAQYLRGVTNDQVVILDAAKILADPRIIVDDGPPAAGTNQSAGQHSTGEHL
jgi:purine-binding chemotaxis protein CheW